MSSCSTLDGRHVVAYVLTDSSGRRRSGPLGRDLPAILDMRAAVHPTLEVRAVHIDGTLSRPVDAGSSTGELLRSIGAL